MFWRSMRSLLPAFLLGQSLGAFVGQACSLHGFRTCCHCSRVAVGPAPHRVSWALRARNPGRVRKESGKGTPGQRPKSAQRVHPGVSKESEKSPKVRFLDSFRTLLRLRGALFGHFWGPAPGYSALFRGSGPEGPGRGAGPIATLA